MSGDDENTSDSLSGAPIDFDRLDAIRERFTAGDRFRRIDEKPAVAPDRLVCVYDQRFYPKRVCAARLEIVWFENGDFSLHYHETHESGEFDHRWDRHPSDHNTDTSHPEDWRDVLSMVLSEIEDRQRAFWEE